MRKIEEEMLYAVARKEKWTKDNTRVCPSDDGNSVKIYLHDNHIATKVYSEGKFSTNLSTLRRYPTNTTMSRLRALGVDVCRKAGKTYINGEIVE